MYEARAAALPIHSCFCIAMQNILELNAMWVIRAIQRVMKQTWSDQRKMSKKQPHHIPCDVKLWLQLEPLIGVLIVCP